MTPALQSPVNDTQRWSRVEATALLPKGCSLEIAYASAPDAATRDKIAAQLADPALSPQQRLGAWRAAGGVSVYVVHGNGDEAGQTVAAPLQDVRDPFLWVAVGLASAPGAALPRLDALAVRYPGPSLIQQLPAIYRRGELASGDFLRGFVGVLEATTEDLDARIAELGRVIIPAAPRRIGSIRTPMARPAVGRRSSRPRKSGRSSATARR